MTDEQIETHKQVQEARELGKKAAQEQLPPKRPWWREARSVLAVVAALIAVACVLILLFHNQHVTDQKDTAVGKANAGQDLATQVVSACKTSNGRAQLSARGISCSKASSVAAGQAPATGAPGRAGQNATDEQVQEAVDVYMAGHPVPAEQIDYSKLHTFVTSYLKAHPAPSGGTGPSGVPGKDATGAPGQNGTNGVNGQNATDDQVAAAVAAYLSAHPPADGKDGADGTDGKDGTDGQPPVSWTYQIGVVTYECDRSVPFSEAAPTYTCAPQTTPTDGPTP